MNIEDIKLKADVITAGVQAVITRITITAPRLEGNKLENANPFFCTERAIEITVYDQKRKDYKVVMFSSIKKFENQYRRTLLKFQKYYNKDNYLTTSQSVIYDFGHNTLPEVRFDSSCDYNDNKEVLNSSEISWFYEN